MKRGGKAEKKDRRNKKQGFVERIVGKEERRGVWKNECAGERTKRRRNTGVREWQSQRKCYFYSSSNPTEKSSCFSRLVELYVIVFAIFSSQLLIHFWYNCVNICLYLFWKCDMKISFRVSIIFIYSLAIFVLGWHSWKI